MIFRSYLTFYQGILHCSSCNLFALPDYWEEFDHDGSHFKQLPQKKKNNSNNEKKTLKTLIFRQSYKKKNIFLA